jgi:hypothetical protein
MKQMILFSLALITALKTVAMDNEQKNKTQQQQTPVAKIVVVKVIQTHTDCSQFYCEYPGARYSPINRNKLSSPASFQCSRESFFSSK